MARPRKESIGKIAQFFADPHEVERWTWTTTLPGQEPQPPLEVVNHGQLLGLALNSNLFPFCGVCGYLVFQLELGDVVSCQQLSIERYDRELIVVYVQYDFVWLWSE